MIAYYESRHSIEYVRARGDKLRRPRRLIWDEHARGNRWLTWVDSPAGYEGRHRAEVGR